MVAIARRVRGLGVDLGVVLALIGLLPASAAAVDGNVVLESAKLAPPATVGSGEEFGAAIASLGNLNGTGGPDIAVGAARDDASAGAVYVFFLDAEGVPLSSHKIPATAPLGGGRLGLALAYLGDLDGDGLPSLAIGAPDGSGGGISSGVVWIAELNPSTGAVVGALRIASGENGFPTGQLDASDLFGAALANAGDWDGDGRPELIVGAYLDDDGGFSRGALYILYLNANGSVRQSVKISDTAGGLDAVFAANAWFGSGVAAVGDQDGDGQTDLAVGAPFQGSTGSVFLLFLQPGCSAATPVCAVKAGAAGYRQIANGVGGFPAQDLPPVRFGRSLAWLPAGSPLANDRLAVGDPDSNSQRGVVWLFEVVSGQLLAPKRIASQENWSVALDASDQLGFGLGSLGDLNGDSATDLAIGAIGDDDVPNAGTTYFAVLSPCAAIITRPKVYHDPDDVGRDPCLPVPLASNPVLHLYIESGGAVSGVPANACTGAPANGHEMCAWDVRLSVEPPLILQGFTPALSGLRTSDVVQLPHELRINWIGPATPQNGKVKIGDVMLSGTAGGQVTIASGSAAVGADLQLQTIGVRAIGLPEPGIPALFAGIALLTGLARRRTRTTALSLAVALGLGLAAPAPARAETSISGQVRITWTSPGFNPPSVYGQWSLGRSLAPLGDLDGDGTFDFAVGSGGGCTCSLHERVFTMFLQEEGVLAGFDDEVRATESQKEFSESMALLPDRNGDGVQDLVIGAPRTTYSSNDYPGQVSIVFLDRAGREAAPRVVIGNGLAGLPAGTLGASGHFGDAVASLGDVDGNGTLELAVGAPALYPSNPGGELWLLSLDAANQVVAFREVNLPSLGEPTSGGPLLGRSVVSVGDLDGDGYGDVVAGAPGQTVSSVTTGALYVLFLEPDGAGGVQVKSHQRISPGQAGLDIGIGVHLLELGRSLVWLGGLEGGGGVLAVGISGRPSLAGVAGAVLMLHLRSDGTVGQEYRIAADENVGAVISATNDNTFGSALAAPGDIDGDEVADLLVGAEGALGNGAFFVFFLKDADHDGLDDVLDNCKDVHNPQQEDADADKVGDLCDNCVDLANTNQADVDADGEGNVCEPVEVLLQTTGTPASPSWNLSLQCGAYSVTNLAGAIVLPAGASNPKTLSLTGTSIGTSSVSGPGLVSPAGVRSDAIYFQAAGNGAPDNRLCTALQAPVSLGTLTTGAISGTQLAASALSAQGVGTPGFGLSIAKIAGSVSVPLSNIRLVNGIPLPILDLELGPAVQTASGTRWEVRTVRSNAEFHRVAFGLIAPSGTTTSQMRWRGCDTAPSGSGARLCCESPPCGDFDGLGVGSNVNPNRSFTVGPQTSPPSTQLPHTMYVVLEGSALSSGSLDTVNPVTEGQYHILGEVELTGSPELEPALTHDGVNDVTFPPALGGGTVVPLVDVAGTPRNVEQVKLIGAFNPSADVDDDGIQDLGDNCPFAGNTAQTNRGAFLDPNDDSDAFGDACQCAESTNDGAVLDPGDFEQIRDYLARRVSNPVIAQEIEARCSVSGTPECNIRDLVYLKLALDTSAPSVETRCDAALSPAQGP